MPISRTWALAFAQFFSLAVVGLALTALVGHVGGWSALYTWRGTGATSIPTAAMNLCSGVAVLLLTLAVRDDEG